MVYYKIYLEDCILLGRGEGALHLRRLPDSKKTHSKKKKKKKKKKTHRGGTYSGWGGPGKKRSYLGKFLLFGGELIWGAPLNRLWNFLFICLCVTEETAHSIPSFSSPPLPKTKKNKTTPVDRATLPSHPLPFSFWEKLHSHTTLLIICREVLVVVVPHAFYFSATNCVFRHCLASTIVKCPCLDI